MKGSAEDITTLSAEDITKLLEPFMEKPSIIQYSEDAKTKDAAIDSKQILAQPDLAGALLASPKMNRSTIPAALNAYQI